MDVKLDIPITLLTVQSIVVQSNIAHFVIFLTDSLARAALLDIIQMATYQAVFIHVETVFELLRSNVMMEM